MSIISGDNIQSLWKKRLNDPLIYNMLVGNKGSFLKTGLIDITSVPFICYVCLLKACFPKLPILINGYFQSMPSILYECVVIGALIDYRESKKRKGISASPCVDICMYVLNGRFLGYGKAGTVYNTPFHNLLKNRFKSVFNLNPGDRVPAPTDCKVYNCKKYNERIVNNYKECCNVLGNCAEQRAANEVLNAPTANGAGISDLRFSLALRPRTMEMIPYCFACRSVFPKLI